MSVDGAKGLMDTMIFMSEKTQMDKYFGKDGVAAAAAAALGVVFSDASDGAAIAKTIDSSFFN